MNSPITTSTMTPADHAKHDQAQRKVYRNADGRVQEKPMMWGFTRR